MALIPITQIFFDTESQNVKIKIKSQAPVDYDYSSAGDGIPFDYLVGELFLSGSVRKIGEFRPKSIDNTIAGYIKGNNFGEYSDTGIDSFDSAELDDATLSSPWPPPPIEGGLELTPFVPNADSSRLEWADYASSLGILFSEEATKEEIIQLVEDLQAGQS